MNQKYTEAELEIIHLENVDVIATSNLDDEELPPFVFG